MALAKKRKATLAGDEARSALPQRRVHRPLMDSKAFDLALADMPGGNRQTLHVLAAAAEHERYMIGERTHAMRLPPPRTAVSSSLAVSRTCRGGID